MGSAQSARRIQPGGGSGRAGGPADLSRSPFLPTPPPALPPPLASPPASPRAGGGGGVAGVGGRGRGWGRRGTAPRPATGRRRAHFHRGGAPRPAPGRLGRPAGKVARGGPAVVVVVVVVVVRGRRLTAAAAASAAASAATAGPTSPSVTAPRQQGSPNPGAEGARPVAALSPLPAPTPAGGSPARGRSPRGRAGVRQGGPGRPSHGATALPPRLRLQPGGSGRGGLSPVRPGRVAPSGPGGAWLGGGGGFSPFPRPPRPGATPSGEASARGQRRCRPPTRPVLKHGPRSLTRARVRGSHESRRGAMKVKAALSRRPRWDPEASPVRRGRTTGPSRPPRRGGGA